MTRFPPGWQQYFHPQRLKSNQLAWRPGWHGTGQQPIARVPVTAYRGKISGVPLTGGQVQGVIPGTLSASVGSPGFFQVFGQLAVPAGTYTLNWTVTLAGTVGAGDANNFRVRIAGGATVANSVNAGAAGTYPQSPVTVTGPETLQIESRAGPATSGSIYSAVLTLSGTALGLALTVGPQGLGTVWYPVQVTLSTTTGPLDTSLANIYLGPLITPATLVGTGLGNGTYALAIPSMTPGQFLVIQWSGATAGDTAAANVIGTMDALTTG